MPEIGVMHVGVHPVVGLKLGAERSSIRRKENPKKTDNVLLNTFQSNILKSKNCHLLKTFSAKARHRLICLTR